MRRALERAVAVAREGQTAEPSIDPPKALKPLLRFHTLPKHALATVARCLDEDEAFRRRTNDSVDGEALDAAAQLFLSRPPGWHEELAAMVAARASADEAAEEQRRERDLERELARSEERLAELDRLARTSVEDVRRLTDELDEIRRHRRTLIDDLDAAVARAEALEHTAEEARRRADEAQAALAVRERELATSREQLQRLATELDGRPPRPDQAPPTVDAKPMREALAVLRQALSETEAALSASEQLLPPEARRSSAPKPTRRTSKPRRRPTSLPGGVRDDSAEAALHLAAQPSMVFLVDGYNVSMAAWIDAELAEQRDRLVTRLETLAARTGVQPVVVFDGAQGHVPMPARPRQQVLVRFSSAGVEADDEILDLVEEHPTNRPVTVVSNDRRVLEGAQQRGANTITSTQLLGVL